MAVSSARPPTGRLRRLRRGDQATRSRTSASHRPRSRPRRRRPMIGRPGTIWLHTQNAQISRFILAGALGLDPTAIRVITPDVGGGFGARSGWTATDHGGLGGPADRRPVRGRNPPREPPWHDERAGPAAGHHARRDAARPPPRVPARDHPDTGAYPRISGFLPGLTSLMAVGRYQIPHVETAFRVVVTNTTPVSAYRGRAPRGHGRDRAGRRPVRRRDRHGPGRGPAAQPDPGRQLPLHDRERGRLRQRGLRPRPGHGAGRQGYAALRESRPAAAGRRRAAAGLRLASYVEITAATRPPGDRPVRRARGRPATVYTGSSAHGQGHHTAWAMLGPG